MKHGQARRNGMTNLYRRWEHMKQRCLNPNDRDYPRYGAKGVTVCDRWANGENGLTGFECFVQDMGDRPDKTYSIDRIDVTKGYEPANCRWATAKQQANNRSTTKYLTIDGVTKPLSDWCEEYGIGSKTVLWRLKHKNMTHKEAVTTKLTWTRGNKNETND